MEKIKIDPAAILAIAMSIDAQAHRSAYRNEISDTYNGSDEFMREAMRVAASFEAWASEAVDWDELDEWWPYLAQDKFGIAMEQVDITPLQLRELNTVLQFVQISRKLRLPLKEGAETLPIPTLEAQAVAEACMHQKSTGA